MSIATTMAGVCVAATLAVGAPALAQDCFIGEVKMFAGAFAPQGYALANGQLLPIQQYSALFSILGTTYGGDGSTNFALPDLRGRVPIGAGQGKGLDNVDLGRMAGDRFTQPRQGEAAAGSGAAVAVPAPISNMQPSTAVNYIVCVEGIYPSRP